MPCPCVAKTTVRCSSSACRKASIARSTSPRIGSIAANSKNVVSGSKSVPNGLSSLALMPALVISSKSSCQSMYVPAPSWIGALAPSAAFDQEALRNSSLVASKSAARDLMRCSSIKTICVFAGIRVSRLSVSSINNGIRDSMPSKVIPSAILLSISAAAGYSSAISKARCFVALLSKSSRQG